MISLDEARALIAQAVWPLDPVNVPLAEAHGRVLREDVRAEEDAPAFDRAAMDGYAVGLHDRAERFRIVAEIQPGVVSQVAVGPGECARIFTGAALPPGATQIIMQEDTEREGDWLRPTRRTAATHIRWRGEDARRGDLALAAGTRLGPVEAALLAQLGITHPLVAPRPRVLHFTTGKELVDPGLAPGPGQIRDSNSTLVAALLAGQDAQLVRQARVGDSLPTLVAALEAEPANTWDVLLISGGASVGDYDFGARALEQLGMQILFRKINLRPGKPLVFAIRGRQLAFVIPGNPVSHFVTFHTAIAHALEGLQHPPRPWSLARVPLARELPAPPDQRETWWPARVFLEAGTLTAAPLAWQSSGDLGGIVSANALLRLPPETPPLATGGECDAFLLDLPG